MKYFDLIITHHAQDQIAARGLNINEVYETFKHPNRSDKGKYSGVEFQKEFRDHKVTVVAFQNDHNEWVVKTAWRNPELPGTADARRKAEWKKMNKANFWGKIYLTIKNQIFGA